MDIYVKKALTRGSGLTVQEFIEVAEYPVDCFMVDNFFHNLSDDIPIYVTRELIEWCGFNSKEFKLRKREFKRILENFEKGVDYWTFSNKEYTKYYKTLSLKLSPDSLANYPIPTDFYNKNKTKHLVLTVDCFKEMMMLLRTPRAPVIRKHYIQMEKLLFLYMEYQCACLRLSLDDEITKIKNFSHVEKYSRLQRVRELDATLYKKYRVGVVYFICEDDRRDIVKIGYTFNLNKRLEALQCAHYKKLIVKKYYFAQFPHEEEQRLHSIHADRHIRGEWFSF